MFEYLLRVATGHGVSFLSPEIVISGDVAKLKNSMLIFKFGEAENHQVVEI